MTALHRPRTRTGPAGRRDVAVAVTVVLCIVTPVLVALDAPATVRGPFVAAFFLIVPGLALTSLLGLDDPASEVALVLGVGLGLLTVGAQVMVTLRMWNVVVATDVVAASSLAALVADVARRRRRDSPRREPEAVAVTAVHAGGGSSVVPLAHGDTRASDVASDAVVGNLARSPEPEPVVESVSPSPPQGRAGRVDVEVLAHTVLLADAAVLWIVSLRRLHVGGVSGIGLVSALPVTYFLALATLTAGFAWAVASRRDNALVLAAYTVGLVLVLHATTAAVYPEPRYAWVYKHLGVVRYIGAHGSVDRDVDIYQNWPGFFALVAWFSRVSGWSPTTLAAWAQPAFELLNVSALVFCFRGFTRDRRVVWCAVWIFLAANWLGQDYLSPQAFAFFEGMVVVGLVVRCARREWSPSTRPGRAWARAVDWVAVRAGGIGPGRAAEPLATTPRVDAPLAPTAALVCGAWCFASIVVSHQLTPFVIVTLVAVLVLLRQARPVWLPFVMLAAAVAWLAFAWPFVSRHFDLFNPAQVSTAHPSGFRSGHALPGVHTVDLAKIAVIAAIVLLAVAGLWLQRRERRTHLFVAALAAAPIVPAALQSYGGEGWLRALLFALPWLAFLAAPVCLAVPHAARMTGVRASWTRLAATAAVSALLLPLFLITYFGQETVNYMSPSDVAVNRWYLQHAPDGSVVSFIAGNSPARLGARYAVMSVGDGSTTVTDLPGMDGRHFQPRDVDRIADMLSSPRGTARYLVSSPSQTRFLAYYGIVPPGWVRDLDDTLLFSSRFRLVYHDDGALVFQLVELSPGARGPRA